MGTQPSPKRRWNPLPNFRPISIVAKRHGCIKMPLGMEVGLSPGDFVFHGDPVRLPKKGTEPSVFGPCLLRPNGCMDQDATWYGGRPRPRRHCVRWGPSSPSSKRRRSPLLNFRLMSIAAKRKMARGMEVGLGPGHIVLDGDPAPLPQKGADPQFSAHFYCGQTAG